MKLYMNQTDLLYEITWLKFICYIKLYVIQIGL